jgi:trehalose synthase
MRITDTADLWWKSAVIYCLDVETFVDWNGDGVGDFVGLSERIDHLAELGITCLWLMPFYVSANRDDGYDVIDHYGVDPRFGTHGDLVELIRTARDRGIRVIVDLVVNHTSDRHPWFQEARKSKDNPFRDFYVWRADTPPDTSDKVMFPDEEESIWEYDERTGEYYLHYFYRHQPDLNIINPRVRDEIAKIMGFWLQLGVSGFRIDAVPYMIDTDGIAAEQSEELSEPHGLLRSIRAFIDRRSGGALALGEVNLPYEDARRFFGDGHGDQLAMLFDFTLNQRLFLALARKSAQPLVEVLRARPEIPRNCQWGNFVRNHDELSLSQLDDAERDEVFAAFGPEPRMQIFERGLRRRLAPMLEGDPEWIRMVYALAFALPGTPVLYYGEEIGMGENLEIPGRGAVRTPMQWREDLNGGFSTAPASALVAPLTEGEFGPAQVNVAAQRRDRDSLLAFFSLLIARYRECPELGWAPLNILDQPHEAVLALCSSVDDATVVTLHNLSEQSLDVPLQLENASADHELIDLFEMARIPVDADGSAVVELGRYGYRWLRLTGPGNRHLV